MQLRCHISVNSACSLCCSRSHRSPDSSRLPCCPSVLPYSCHLRNPCHFCFPSRTYSTQHMRELGHFTHFRHFQYYHLHYSLHNLRLPCRLWYVHHQVFLCHLRCQRNITHLCHRAICTVRPIHLSVWPLCTHFRVACIDSVVSTTTQTTLHALSSQPAPAPRSAVALLYLSLHSSERRCTPSRVSKSFDSPARDFARLDVSRRASSRIRCRVCALLRSAACSLAFSNAFPHLCAQPRASACSRHI